MFLKRITVAGFKSFCDRVDFDFGPGVTCVVGPNGCGKSNVVDALKWVLGEQSARSLRGRQMIDMIFNGSSSRRSSSLAQVELHFDNADRTLNMDSDEVVVTRKLYRSGESEYLLNQASARLKDIRELFLDTGIGVGAYSIIEQGRVDALLHSSAADRRVIFEEAAGISRYKARRKEAQRKLERTEQNLLRVEDIIEELAKRLRSVKLQAGKARNYKEYEARLNELRSSFAMAEYHRFSQVVAKLAERVDEHSDRATGLQTDIDRCETDEAQITVKLDKLADEISEADNTLVRNQSDLAAARERIESADARLDEQSSTLQRAHARRNADEQKLADARTRFDEAQGSVERLQTETDELHGRIDELNEEDRELAREHTQALAILEDEKAGIIDLLRKSAQTHNEIIRLNTHRESLVGQKGRLAQRDTVIRGELEAALEQRVQMSRRLNEVEALIEQETARLGEKKAEAARIDAVRQSLVDELAEAKERRSALLSRREVLDDLQRRRDGIGAGVRQVLDRQHHPDAHPYVRAVDGLVADVFEVDVEHARVIEAAVGESDQCLVVSDSRLFLEDPAVFATLDGRLAALRVDGLPPLVNSRDFSQEPGFVARAIDLVRFDARHERLAIYLLGKTVVVDNLDTALRLAREDVSSHRFVTTDGDLVESNGRISLGPPDAVTGLISRKSELRDIDEQLTAQQQTIASLSDTLNRTQAEAAHLDGVQQELRTAIYESNTAKVEANAALQSIAETVDRLSNEQPLIAQEVALIEQQIDEVHAKSSEGNKSLEAIEADNQRREALVSAHQERINGLAARRHEVQANLTQLKVANGQLSEKRAAAAQTINALRHTMHELEASIENAAHDVAQCTQRIAEAASIKREAGENVTRLSERIERDQDDCARLRQERERLRHHLDELAERVKSARQELNRVLDEMHEHEKSLAETRVRRDDLVARIRDEMDIDLVERYRQYEHEEQDWEAVETEIAELRRKMDRLGNVNLDAIQELEELEHRHDFLTQQRDDLNSSRRQLEQLINQLNAESEQRFREAFEKIRDHFRQLFRKLFGGGRADIVIEDPENMLDSGIEIVAQPPGKDLQSISLMSGGEKSMTAIALLMSIFKNRPAPFAILDEVDAALDEANNDRFNRIVQEFVSQSQFLIITHSKRTMSIGDHLYGITMQEPGVSTRVSVELGDVNAA